MHWACCLKADALCGAPAGGVRQSVRSALLIPTTERAALQQRQLGLTVGFAVGVAAAVVAGVLGPRGQHLVLASLEGFPATWLTPQGSVTVAHARTHTN